MANDVPHKNILISAKTLTKIRQCGKNNRFRRGWKRCLNPSLTHVGKTSVGKGLGERVFLPVAETQANRIRPDIQCSFIHGVGAVGAIEADRAQAKFCHIG